jgi:hypothetical protein
MARELTDDQIREDVDWILAAIRIDDPFEFTMHLMKEYEDTYPLDDKGELVAPEFVKKGYGRLKADLDALKNT